MNAADGDHHEGNSRFPVPTTCEDGCCGDDQTEDDAECEVESHCGGGCCADDKESNCESEVDHCKDGCCDEQSDIQEEPVNATEQQGTLRVPPHTQGCPPFDR